MSVEVEGVIHKVSVGKELRIGAVMNFQIGHEYINRTCIAEKIIEVFEHDLFWVKIYVSKKADNDGVLYLWKKIGDKITVEYDVDKIK